MHILQDHAIVEDETGLQDKLVNFKEIPRKCFDTILIFYYLISMIEVVPKVIEIIC